MILTPCPYDPINGSRKHSCIMERFCEECGKSCKVRLNPCNRCGMVMFCRDKCKMRAFSTHHRGVCAM